ncbi:MAG: CvpA family protein, partial [Rubrobacter sp.]
MAALDLIIALFVALTVLRGARTGFLAGVFSLVGVVVGASVGSRLAPYLMPEESNALYGAGITLASILAFAVLGEILARAIGGALRNRLSNPASETLDGLGGAALGLALSLVLVWALGFFVLQSQPLPGLHPAVEESRILQALTDRMPTKLLTRAVAELDRLPQIQGPEPDVAAPDGS